jgi:hypothetical protein
MRSRVGPLRVAQLLRPARGPRSPKGLAASGAEMCMRRRVAPAARARPMVPDEPTAGAASYSAVQLRRGPRSAHGPSWARGRRCTAEHAARCRSCGVADGVVNQVGPSCTAHGSSELVKAHTPRRGRPSCRNSIHIFQPYPRSTPAFPCTPPPSPPCPGPGGPAARTPREPTWERLGQWRRCAGTETTRIARARRGLRVPVERAGAERKLTG